MRNHRKSQKFRIFIGRRFVNNRKGRANVVFYTLFGGIALGLAALVVVLGVMNGFQDSYITRRVEVGSYHIDIYSAEGFENYKAEVAKLYSNIEEVEAAVGYTDREVVVLFKNRVRSDRQPVKLRAIDSEEIKKDTQFNRYFDITHGKFSLGEGDVLLGEELGWRQFQYARLGSSVYLTKDMTLQTLRTEQTLPFTVTGYFNTGSYDYDRYWAFISLDGYAQLQGRALVEHIGIKLYPGANVGDVVSRVKGLFCDTSYVIKTAEETNHAYFSALRLEKIMIMFLFVIIFAMVGTNLYGSLKLTVLEKQDSILILKALGMTPANIQLVFLFESIVLAIGGSSLGLILGVFIAYNILNIFSVIESIINFILHIAIPRQFFEPIKIYDTEIYYQQDFLVNFEFLELAIIFLVVVSATILSAYIPIYRASKVRPNQIQRGGEQ